MTDVYDSATWPEQPPDEAYGLKYGDGQYLEYQGKVAFLHRKLITVHGHYRTCEAIDPERGNWAAYPWTLRRFVRGRRSLAGQSLLYTDRADAREHLVTLGWQGEPWPDVIGSNSPLWAYTDWWVATLDDRPWTADELAADLAQTWDAPIPAHKIWGNQRSRIAQGGIDVTTLFGPW